MCDECVSECVLLALAPLLRHAGLRPWLATTESQRPRLFAIRSTTTTARPWSIQRLPSALWTIWPQNQAKTAAARNCPPSPTPTTTRCGRERRGSGRLGQWRSRATHSTGSLSMADEQPIQARPLLDSATIKPKLRVVIDNKQGTRGEGVKKRRVCPVWRGRMEGGGRRGVGGGALGSFAPRLQEAGC